MTSALTGANAYANVARLTSAASQAANNPSSAKVENSFGDMVKDAVQDIVETGKSADKKTVAMAQGKADVVDVVTAIAETEVALETMVTIRDRVITAYQEILRMPI